MTASGPWVISQTDFQQCEVQFITLSPTDGFLSGEQARNFFLKSGLPPPILAQIWGMADLTCDGKLDALEFAIAMKLIRNTRANIPLPSILPETMKHVAPPPPQPYMRLPAYGMPQMLPQTTYLPGQVPAAPIQAPFIMGTKELCEWSIPQAAKLKYSQKFNQLDKDRQDYLTGQQVRGVMGESQLPSDVLAQIWALSDSNREGFLSIEKFCVAMFLIDKVKEGYALPKSLPPELQAFICRSRTESPVVVAEPGAPPPQKTPTPRTFEDKRRDNLDKGEAELERRRQVLREEEERRRAEVERREREESERREKEREEQEKLREAEREKQRQREKELEEQRLAEESRIRAEREEARKKYEEERLKSLEERYVKDLEIQLQSEKEKTAHFKQRHSTMTFQLQGLEEKAQQYSTDIAVVRDEIMSITSEIEGMRGERDAKVAQIQELQTKNQDLAVQTERLSHTNLQLQGESQRSVSRVREIDALRQAITDRTDQIEKTKKDVAEAKERSEKQQLLVVEKRPSCEKGQEQLQKLVDRYNELLKRFKERQGLLRAKIAPTSVQPPTVMNNIPPQQELYELPPDVNSQSVFSSSLGNSGFGDSFDPKHSNAFTTVQTNDAFASSFGSMTHAHGAQNHSSKPPVKYRALFEFVARSEDELSLQPGDTILVFEDHASEPGWFAGQIRDKVGWFPADFAEPASKKSSQPAKQTSIHTSPSTEPLESIKEEPLEKDSNAADFTPAFIPSASSNSLSRGPTASGDSSEIVSSQPLYDAPPDLSPEKTVAPIPKPPSAVVPSNGSTNSSQVGAEGNGSTTVISVAIAQFPWKPRNETELAFSRSDQIEILEKTEMRWRGRVSGQTKCGWFPKSYVKESEGSAVVSSPTTSSVSAIKQPTGEWYIAVYDFDAIEPTDLSLHVGDRIWVTETKDEWWKGTVNDKSGIFPANYVQKADADSTPTSEGIGWLPLSANGSNRLGKLLQRLNDAYQLLNSLCARVNHSITQMENKNILYWSQKNIRCDSLNGALEFTSETRDLGAREYLHSGVLFKLKSSKILIGMLYNDLLLFATPIEPIEDIDNFKVVKELDVQLLLYKSPMRLDSLEVENTVIDGHNNDETAFVVKNKEIQLQLKAHSRNAKVYWVNQLQKAMDQYDVNLQLRKAELEKTKTATTNNGKEIGRLMIELLNVTNLPQHNVMMKIGMDNLNENTVPLQPREGQSLYTTQFSLHNLRQTLRLSFHLPMKFRPDVRLGELVESVERIVELRGQHQGPIIRSLPLINADLNSNAEISVKFFIQFFD